MILNIVGHSYNSIYLADGRSLHEAAEQLFVKERADQVSNEPMDNYDHCVECGDGGELVLCDGCPGAYHAGELYLDKSLPARLVHPVACRGSYIATDLVTSGADCLLLDEIPEGDWFCPSCDETRSAAGILKKNDHRRRERGNCRVSSVAGAKERNPGRCSRLLKAAENVGGGCVLCR